MIKASEAKFYRKQTSFDALRWIFAIAVMIAHSFALLRLADPLERYSGFYYDFGKLGVTGFFSISGYLVAASWLRNPAMLRFVKARVLRIMPGLVAGLLFGVLVAASVADKPQEFLFNSHVWRWVWHNTLFIWKGFGAQLAGAFPDNPFPHGANGSLWTLTYEIRCYAAVLIMGILGLLRRQSAVVLSSIMLILIYFIKVFSGATVQLQYLELCLAFAMGMLIAVCGFRAAFALAVSTLLAALAATMLHWPGTRWFYAPLQFAIALAVLYIAMSPWLKRFAPGKGDYSYGLYVYAFPLQQLAIVLLGTEATPWAVFALTIAATTPIAILSWHMLEKPALSLVDRSVKAARKEISECIDDGSESKSGNYQVAAAQKSV